MHAGPAAAPAVAIDWSVTAMTEAAERLAVPREWELPRLAAAVSEAVWWVTLVDATLVRYYPRDYETMILLADGAPAFKSEAVIRIAQGLVFPWSLAAILRVLPRRWCDRLYDRLARNRYRVFGRRDTCYLPDPRWADRFLA